MCSSVDGYRELRSAVQASGARGIFAGPISTIREFRCDQYGLRAVLSLQDQPIKFEIVLEGRISLDGALDPKLGCPTLSLTDQCAEKLLANSDRCYDPAVCYRDAFDLGMLVIGNGGIMPEAAIAKSVVAYGDDIWRKLRWVVSRLGQNPALSDGAASSMQMDPETAWAAIQALGGAVRTMGPDKSFDWNGALRPMVDDEEEEAEHDRTSSLPGPG